MDLEMQRVNNSILLATTSKGLFRINLETLKSVSLPTTLGIIHPSISLNVSYSDNSSTCILFSTEEEGKDFYEFITSQFKDYLLHLDVFENSSAAPKTRLVSDNELVLEWGAHRLLIDLKSFKGMSESLGCITIFGEGWKHRLTSSRKDYLDLLNTSLELNILKRKK